MRGVSRGQMAKVELEKLSEKSRTCLRRSPTGRERGFSAHFAFRIPAKSTLGALLMHLFGQSLILYRLANGS
jgi:hypothetical protein